MSLVLLANLLIYFDRSIGTIAYFFHKFLFFLYKIMVFCGYSTEKYHKSKSLGQNSKYNFASCSAGCHVAHKYKRFLDNPSIAVPADLC